MSGLFYNNQNIENRNLYIELLKVTGSLSNLFAETKNPFLYYRAMENIFCIAFEAENFSRSDISADAGKNKVGIGLKTFLQNNGNTFQKIAEFNKESYLLKDLNPKEIVYKASMMRNERINSTKRICKLDDMIYHVITRSPGSMSIYEEPMDKINLDKIRITSSRPTTIHFTDGLHEYNFNVSKSTLLKRFNTNESVKLHGFNVRILEDPFNFLLGLSKRDSLLEESFKDSDSDIIDFIVLPLYSARTGQVEEFSGLNQWNASGRKRDVDEVYIPIPAWIHRKKSGFFTYNTDDHKTEPFEVRLPSGDILSMRVAQQGGKGLMSDPNKALGNWLLRDVLNLKVGTVVTKEMLDIIGIDSVQLSKRKDGSYSLDFLKSGSFDSFKEQFDD